MTILKTIEFSGSASPQKIDLPDVPSHVARMAYVVNGNAEAVEILQEDDPAGPRLIVPADDGSGFAIAPLPLTGGTPPEYILVDAAEAGTVTLTIVRIPS